MVFTRFINRVSRRALYETEACAPYKDVWRGGSLRVTGVEKIYDVGKRTETSANGNSSMKKRGPSRKRRDGRAHRRRRRCTTRHGM